MKNKNAQIGETLTWFMAFIIIFFIILLFTILTIILSSKKEEFREENFSTDLINYEKIISILNSKISYENREIYFKDLIKEYYTSEEKDNNKKKFIENTFKEKLKGCYYYITIFREEEEDPIYINNLSPSSESINEMPDFYSGIEEIESAKENEIYLIGDKKIKINFYLKNEE